MSVSLFVLLVINLSVPKRNSSITSRKRTMPNQCRSEAMPVVKAKFPEHNSHKWQQTSLRCIVWNPDMATGHSRWTTVDCYYSDLCGASLWGVCMYEAPFLAMVWPKHSALISNRQVPSGPPGMASDCMTIYYVSGASRDVALSLRITPT